MVIAHKFWSGQPVAKPNSKNSLTVKIIEKNLREMVYNKVAVALPDGLEWTSLDLNNSTTVRNVQFTCVCHSGLV